MPEIDMKAIAAVTVLLVGALVLVTAKRSHHIVLFGLIAALALYPAQLTSSGNESYAGLSQAQPTITTYAVLVGLAAIVLSARRSLQCNLLFAPFVVYFVFAVIFLWEWNSYTQAGSMHLVVALGAWCVGVSYARLARKSERIRVTILAAVATVIFLQLVVSGLQLINIDPFALAPSIAELMGTRVHGTMNHPNNLGKVLVLLSALILPLIDAPSSRTRNCALWALGAAGLGVVLTQGRANTIAFILLVLLRIVSLRGSRAVGQRLLVFLVIAAGIAPFFSDIVARFIEDPEGGSRSHFTRVALSQLEKTPFWGIGPNEYVHVVGQSDALTSGNLPVHNSYLLAAVDLGVVGAVLFFGPMLIVAARAFRHRQAPGYDGRVASSSLSLSFAYVIVAATGWGSISTYLLPLWLFVLGYLSIHSDSSTTKSYLSARRVRRQKEARRTKLLANSSGS